MLLAIAGIMIFASCKKDESTPAPLSTEEATIAINAVDGDYTTIMTEIDALTGKQSIEAVTSLGLPAPMRAPQRPTSYKSHIQQVFKQSQIKGEGFFPFEYFDFEYYKGTWQYADGSWTKTLNTPTDKAVFLFNFNGGTNNGTLTYWGYTEKTATLMGMSTTFMTQLNAKIEISGRTDNPVLTWKYTASGTGSASSIAAKMTFEYNVGAFTRINSFSLNLSGGQSAVSFTMAWLDEVKKEGVIAYSNSFSISASVNATGFNASITAKFRIKDIVIKYLITLDENTNIDNGDPSQYMKVSIWTIDGAKVADVVFHYENLEYVPYFKFKDDSEVLITEYLSEGLYSDLGYFMENIFKFFFMIAGN